jgi:hypothetical protein
VSVGRLEVRGCPRLWMRVYRGGCARERHVSRLRAETETSFRFTCALCGFPQATFTQQTFHAILTISRQNQMQRQIVYT